MCKYNRAALSLQYDENAQAFTEITVIVDGTLDESEIFTDDRTGLLWLIEYSKELHNTEQAEIYVLVHGHPIDVEECQCIQYETDYSPDWILPRDTNTLQVRLEEIDG